MSATRSLGILFLSTITLFSCSKEEFAPQSQRIQGFQQTTGDDPEEYPVAPIAELRIQPCGYGFYVEISNLGGELNAPYMYEIRFAGTNTVVHSGTITNGGHTAWSMTPCTLYDFEFWGLSTSTTYSTVQTISTDGCGGTFGC